MITRKNETYSTLINIWSNINSINDYNTSLGEDAIHRVSTDGLLVTFFFQISITLLWHSWKTIIEANFQTFI
jgi:hypothetical protein